jgi:SNF2 family DNA or RNA helicase
MPKLSHGEDQLELSLTGAEDFQAALAAVKAIPGRRFDGDRKLWCFPEDPAIAERLMVTVKPELSPDLLGWIKASKKNSQKELVTPLPDDADLIVPWAKQRVHWQPEFVGPKSDPVEFKGLYAFQRAFADFAAGKTGNDAALLLADDMGLGKCGQSSSAIVEWMMRSAGLYDMLANNPNGVPVEGLSCAADMLKWAAVEDGPKLIISPASVKGTWGRELRMWLGQAEPIFVIDGAATPKRRNAQLLDAINNSGWAVINWEQLRVKREIRKVRTRMMHAITGEFLGWKEKDKEVTVLREPLFEETPWVAAVADEAHRAKNRKALTTQGLWRVSAGFKMALTGTPLMNSPDELWSILRWLYPEEYTSYWRFFDQYVDFYEGQYGKIITGVKNADALRFELSTRLVRRTKDEVLDQLPEKTREFVPITLNKKQRKLYDEAEKQLWFEVEQAIKDGDRSALKFAKEVSANPAAVYTVPNGAARIVRLRQIASTPALLGGEDDSAKLDAAVETITDNIGSQFVVFSEFVDTCHILVERLRRLGVSAEAFTGQSDSEDRTRMENDFQAGEIDVLVGTIGAMKEGITLTAASNMIFLERHWTPAVNEQCEDRCHRNGQKNAVTILIFEAEDTVDAQKISPTNAIKSLIVSSVIAKDDVAERRRK